MLLLLLNSLLDSYQVDLYEILLSSCHSSFSFPTGLSSNTIVWKFKNFSKFPTLYSVRCCAYYTVRFPFPRDTQMHPHQIKVRNPFLLLPCHSVHHSVFSRFSLICRRISALSYEVRLSITPFTHRSRALMCVHTCTHVHTHTQNLRRSMAISQHSVLHFY